jgi:hypothetical protein
MIKTIGVPKNITATIIITILLKVCSVIRDKTSTIIPVQIIHTT